MKTLFCMILLASSCLGAGVWIAPPETWSQYETMAGPRLHMAFGIDVPFPPTNFDGWELIIAREYSTGFYPPYIGTYIYSELPQRDPEFQLLSRLDNGVTYYCRARCFTDGVLWGETDEFQISFSGETAPTFTEYTIPYVVNYGQYSTAIALQTDSAISITIELCNIHGDVLGTQTQSVNGLWIRYFDYLFGIEEFTGFVRLKSMAPFRYSCMILDDRGYSAITYTGGVQ